MKNEILIRVYTRPLFELALETQLLDALGAEVKTLGDLFAQVPMLVEYLDSPNVTRSTKLDLLKQAYGKPLSKPFGSFIDLVLRKGRQEMLPYAWEAFEQYWDDYRQKLEVIVTTAVPLSEDQKQKLILRLAQNTGKKITLKTQLDPLVLGGIRFQIGHQLVDATVAGKLASLKEALLKA